MGTYELQGRYKASRTTEGRFIDVKYGVDRSQRMPAHMKRPLPSRLVSPGAAGAWARYSGNFVPSFVSDAMTSAASGSFQISDHAITEFGTLPLQIAKPKLPPPA